MNGRRIGISELSVISGVPAVGVFVKRGSTVST